ncbi:MAG: ATP-binding protein [Fidelibacterota bacterium]
MMSKSKNIFIFLLIVAKLLSGDVLKPSEEAVAGVIDLSGTDISTGETLKLDGQWEFYWKQLLTPEQVIAQDNEHLSYISVPGIWTDKYHPEEQQKPTGYATYRLKVKITNGNYYLAFPYIFTSAVIWINGSKVIELGKVADHKNFQEPHYMEYYYPVEVNDGTIDIVINVANYHHSKSGIRTSVKIGNKSDLHSHLLKTSANSLFIIIIGLLIGFFHLIVYLTQTKSRKIPYLLFGIFAFLFSIRLIIIEKALLYYLFPDISWFVITKMEWIIASTTAWLGLLFFVKKYPRDVNGVLWKIILSMGLLLTLTLLLLDTYYMSKLLNVILIYAGIIICQVLWILFKAMQKRREDSVVLFVSLIIMFFAVMVDFYLNNKLDYNFNVITYGFLIVMLSYSYNLIVHMQAISTKLKEYQNNLEEMIMDRTQQLEESKLQLEQKVHEIQISESKLKRTNKELNRQIHKTEEVQKALKSSEKRFRELADMLPEIVYETDYDLNFTYVNQMMVEKFGYSRKEFLSRINSRDLLQEKDVGILLNNTYSDTIDTTKNYHEYTFVRKDKSTFPGLINGITHREDDKIVGFRGIVIDLTHLKESENQIKKLRNYLANIINSMPSVMIGINSDYKITFWNTKAGEKYQKSEDTVLNKDLFTICPDLSEQKSLIHQSIATGEIKIFRQQYRHDEKEYFENLTIFPLRENDEGAVVQLDDITEQVRMEELIIQSEKMLSVGGLAAGMAHEINNPLAGMIQNAYVMSRRLSPENLNRFMQDKDQALLLHNFIKDRKLDKLLNLIIQSGHRAAKIVDNMLSFAKQGKVKYSKLQVNQLIDETLELAYSDYDMKKNFDFKKISIHKQFSNVPITIYGEKSKLQQVILNLLKNAAEATHEKLLHSEYPDYTPLITIRTQLKYNMARLEVEDNGPGIPEDIRSRIFEPFFTTKEISGGTGLGLSVSYFIITKNHQGSMHIETKPGKYTKFIVELPINIEETHKME